MMDDDATETLALGFEDVTVCLDSFPKYLVQGVSRGSQTSYLQNESRYNDFPNIVLIQ